MPGNRGIGRPPSPLSPGGREGGWERGAGGVRARRAGRLNWQPLLNRHPGRRAAEGLLVQPLPGVRRPAERRGLRPLYLCHGGDRPPLSVALLEGPDSGAVPAPGRRSGAEHRGGGGPGEEKTGDQVLGAEAVKSQDPHHRLEKMDRSPAPRFHTATESAWRLLYEGYSEFLAAFRTAAEKLKAGDRAAPFPTGSFPPGLPFVTA
jgi:hypothetical protein